MKIINPYNEAEIGEIWMQEWSEIEQKIANARIAKKKMQALSSEEKSTLLKAIVSAIVQRKSEFVQTIVKESGKPYKYAKGEVERAIQTFTVASEECKRLPHELFDIDSTPKGRNLRGEVVYFPKGVVLGISPFNFPLNLVAHKVAPAIASGCPIILKPSERTPLTAELLADVIQSTNLPKNGFQLIHCTKENTMRLVQSPHIDVLSFTGSAKVGWEMKANSGKKRTVLELGGNAMAILTEDADISLAVDELLVGGFAYSGQVCIHTQRILVHESIKARFTAAFIEKVRQLEIGDPMKETTDFGVMIDEGNAKRVESWVDEALVSGANCLMGGSRVGAFYAPTILTDVPEGQKVLDEEIFGPVVSIESFSSLESAIKIVNKGDWGLQAAIFTNRIDERDYAFENLNVGAVIHNKSTTFRVDDMPYGGIKDSGFGREGVRFAMLDFLEPKLLIKSR